MFISKGKELRFGEGGIVQGTRDPSRGQALAGLGRRIVISCSVLAAQPGLSPPFPSRAIGPVVSRTLQVWRLRLGEVSCLSWTRQPDRPLRSDTCVCLESLALPPLDVW